MDKKIFILALIVFAALLAGAVKMLPFIVPMAGLVVFVLGIGYQYLLVRYKARCIAISAILAGLLMLANVSLGVTVGVFMLLVGACYGVALGLARTYAALEKVNLNVFAGHSSAGNTEKKVEHYSFLDDVANNPVINPGQYDDPCNIYHFDNDYRHY